MKKLNINVDRCEVKGGVDSLTPIVQEMDTRLQELATETETIKAMMLKYVSTNSSPQFEKCAVEVFNLSNLLFEASEQLNEMQTQIVKYQISMAEYNEKNFSMFSPNHHAVRKVQIAQDSTNWQFSFGEMVALNRGLINYITSTRDAIRKLQSNKGAVGTVWCDPQYRDFAEFIDMIVATLKNSLMALEEYTIHLKGKIAQMKNEGV